MSEMHTVEVRFLGEMLATYIDASGVCTLYRTPEGLYRVYIEELDAEGGSAWLEGGHLGNGLPAEQVRTLFPEFEHAMRESSSTVCACCGCEEGHVEA